MSTNDHSGDRSGERNGERTGARAVTPSPQAACRKTEQSNCVDKGALGDYLNEEL